MRSTLVLLVGLLACTVALTGCKARNGRARAPTAHGVAVAEVGPEKPGPPRAVVLTKKGWQAARAIAARPGAGKEEKGLVRTVAGWGRTQEEAEQDAVHRATEFLAKFLHQLKPPLALTPTEAYVRQHLLRGPAERQEDLDQDIKDDKSGEVIHVQCWSLTLAVSPQAYAELVRLDQQTQLDRQRAARMLLLAKVLAGVLALLVAVIGYIRIEEWTKGFYTGRVRLVVACLLAAVVLGLLIIA
jgi:hypothetical protein